jgi:hypothetical protein
MNSFEKTMLFRELVTAASKSAKGCIKAHGAELSLKQRAAHKSEYTDFAMKMQYAAHAMYRRLVRESEKKAKGAA